MEQVNMEKFGTFVAELRKSKGMTQKELGERLFVTDKTVSKWERGLSLPNVSLLLPLAEVLDVTVTELLKGGRMQEETLPVAEVEQLVTQSLKLSVGTQERRGPERRKWLVLYLCCAFAAICECILLAVLGCSLEQMSHSVYLSVGMMLFFGGWFCIGAPAALPSYYDENPISYVTDGFFRIHTAGMRFHNRNWPHIVNACRKYALITAVVYPPVYAVLEWFGLNQMFLPSLFVTLAFSLGIIVPIYCVGKKYE